MLQLFRFPASFPARASLAFVIFIFGCISVYFSCLLGSVEGISRQSSSEFMFFAAESWILECSLSVPFVKRFSLVRVVDIFWILLGKNVRKTTLLNFYINPFLMVKICLLMSCFACDRVSGLMGSLNRSAAEKVTQFDFYLPFLRLLPH